MFRVVIVVLKQLQLQSVFKKLLTRDQAADMEAALPARKHKIQYNTR